MDSLTRAKYYICEGMSIGPSGIFAPWFDKSMMKMVLYSLKKNVGTVLAV
jgi:hypothetical protein